MHDVRRWVNRPESGGLNSYPFLTRRQALTCVFHTQLGDFHRTVRHIRRGTEETSGWVGGPCGGSPGSGDRMRTGPGPDAGAARAGLGLS